MTRISDQRPAYFAVPDPTDPGCMTYWRLKPVEKLTPWPPRAKYGPALRKADVPAELSGHDRDEWVRAWADEHYHPWHAAVRAAVSADLIGCAQRFAEFQTRCVYCSRALTDPISKSYGVGPECRRSLPDRMLSLFLVEVGRAHAEHLATEGAQQ